MNSRYQTDISHAIKPLVGLLLIINCMPAVSGENRTSQNNELLNAVEISGISISTPPEEIADILDGQGYTQVNSSLFTKQEQLDNRRKTIFRFEVENTAAYRQITYHRSLSGGRVKSSVEEKPIPAFEIDTAQQLYQIICADVTEDVKTDRSCESAEQKRIYAGQGRFIDIDDHWAVQLSATDSNSAFGIRYTYE
ncbi:hypothetical protein [Nitrosomonas marina]|uniref:Uncharacterized protein n=1 Tax=Nitrosomonas marina TaxID=917 RepID=A0A1H8HGH9_9PROT|nr:hypothetical protein [Nitrosomonas marina]SEN55094.1 hypothetical protein SAMN05216325_12344 [Nitrosomonas marina]